MASNKGNDLRDGKGDKECDDNIIIFPKKKRSLDLRVLDNIDPDISIVTGDGCVLDKLGMSGDECCYILPPHVVSIHFEPALSSPEMTSCSSTAGHLLPVRIILSESAAVTEIDVHDDHSGIPHASCASGTHWVESGRTLYLARHAPEHVAMLSIKFASQPTHAG